VKVLNSRVLKQLNRNCCSRIAWKLYLEHICSILDKTRNFIEGTATFGGIWVHLRPRK